MNLIQRTFDAIVFHNSSFHHIEELYCIRYEKSSIIFEGKDEENQEVRVANSRGFEPRPSILEIEMLPITPRTRKEKT